MFAIPDHVKGRYYTTQWLAAIGTVVPAVDLIRSFAMYVPNSGLYDQIAMRKVANSANALVRIGVYSDHGGLPRNLLLDSGEVDVSTLGSYTVPISLDLPGSRIYWLAALTGGTAWATTATIGTSYAPYGAEFITGQTLPSLGAPQPYGPLPDPFPSSPTVYGVPVAVWLRRG